MKVVLAPAAQADLEQTLSQTRDLFGQRQAKIYAGYFVKAFGLLGENPRRASSRDRSDIRDRARSLHLGVAAGRMSAASHILYYREDRDDRGEPNVIVVRILHERMDSILGLGRAMSDEPPD